VRDLLVNCLWDLAIGSMGKITLDIRQHDIQHLTIALLESSMLLPPNGRRQSRARLDAACRAKLFAAVFSF
jgi:hypothetical protein